VVRYLGFWRRGGRTPRLYSVRDRMQGVRHRMYRLPGYFEAKKWKGYNLTGRDCGIDIMRPES
jgi:hypothetical protein